MPAWGGEWNIVIVRQWSDGPDNFARIRRIVAEHEKRGVKVVLRVLEDPAVYTRMQDAESGEFGYDQAYYQWVQSLARATRGKVRCFLIGNEAELDLGKSYSDLPNAPRHLTLTYDQYARVLRTAVKAIKSVDPGLQVANSGFTDSSLAPAVAQDIYDSQGLTAAQEFWEAWKARDGVRAEGRVRLYRLLNNSEVKRKIEFVRRALREPMGSDLFQLHYYRNWQGLQPMLDWMNREMRAANAVRPVIAAEVGYYVLPSKHKDKDGRVRKTIDWSHYSEDDHARDMMKIFATLLGNGVEQALYWNMRDSDDSGATVRLFKATEDPRMFKPNRVNRAFRMLCKTLNGARSAPARLPSRAGLWEFHFTGKADVSLVWSDDLDLAGLLDGAKELRDVEGQVLARSDIDKPFTGPVYVFW